MQDAIQNSEVKLFSGEFIGILWLHFLAMGSFGIYYFLPQFIRLTGGTEFVIGLIMGAPAAAALFFRLPTGGWVDRYGRRRMVITGLGLLTLASVLPVFAQKAGIYLMLARAGAGATMVIYFTAIVTYVAEKAPPGRRAEAVAVYGAAGFMAQALSPFLCEWLLAALPFEPAHRYRLLFGGAALCCASAFLVSLRMPPDANHHEQHLDPDAWHRVLRSPTMLYLLIPSIVFGTAYTAVFSFVTDFSAVKHLGAPSSFFLSYSVTVILLRLTTGRWLDRIDRRIVIILSLGIIAVGLFAASSAHDSLGLVWVGVLTGTGHGYIFPSLSTLTFDSAQARNRGTSLALYMLGFDLSSMSMSPVLGRIAEVWDYYSMYKLASLLLASGMLVYLTGWRYHAPLAIRRSSLGQHPTEEYIKNPGVIR
ncbi:MAG TPA: MFS transporter [Candidatus Glassbacteria bacterium]|nr:MFS transporter [Candidatus Glassbacteria bacterium]